MALRAPLSSARTLGRACRAAVGAAFLILGVVPGAALADLWAYVDGNGQAHFASEPLDPRYQLFFKGRSSLDPVPAPPPPPTAAELLGDDSLWKRVDGHPNVARFEPLVTRNARENGLEPALVKAVIAVESGYDPAAVSGKGAVGLMQVLPDTGERYGMVGDAKRSIAQKLAEPAINVRVGTRYLKELVARYAGDLELALAAYNAGEGIVDRYGGVPPYPETQAFVRLVLRFREAWLPAPPPAPAPPRPSRVTIVKPGTKP
jgi:soluble lytic murein transglycosylase-like protein